ncbi:response regulator [Rhizobium tubonense]|uniref:Response regulatory domain-containing protein n=1 Tax=Rhizobium tubonense TaxID=484088 RepID=A0A2W4CU80_9HYPH|nr:response regulator [Rhizobium tubonense]PZM08954.1 hypothetical protein CPY51_27500 [Rhizobium tubonense]
MVEPAGEDIERRCCVLVVEDELFISMELEAALTDAGYRVLGPAASVNDALELLSKERPHLAILDFNLGGEKVTPVALKLKSIGVPFVLASASDGGELARYAVFADVGNLGKPTDLKRLLNAVRDLHR